VSQFPLTIVRAKNHVTLKEYFYAVLMLGMKTLPEKGIPAAMGTDGKSIYVNVPFIERERWNQDNCVFGFMHECIHVMSGDMWWAHDNGLDHKTANMAADFWINLQLEKENKVPPPNILLDHKYDGWTKMQIYKDLLQNPPGGGGGSGKGKKQDPFSGDVIPVPPDPQLKAEIGLRVKAAAQAAKLQGEHIPDWAKDLVSSMGKPKVNWRRRLNHLVQQITYQRNDFSYRRHNRRYIPQNIIAPTLWSPENAANKIVVALDTSGSISMAELSQFWCEVKHILKSVNPKRLIVLDVDTDIRQVREYGPHDQIPDEVTVHGRGGTYFTEPFKWVEENHKDEYPQMLIYLTDMYGTFPANDPPYPTIWVATSDHGAPFGEVIRVREEA
jgi:predicted metal-dependent peptidase